jgi:hypothetical protein
MLRLTKAWMIEFHTIQAAAAAGATSLKFGMNDASEVHFLMPEKCTVFPANDVVASLRPAATFFEQVFQHWLVYRVMVSHASNAGSDRAALVCPSTFIGLYSVMNSKNLDEVTPCNDGGQCLSALEARRVQKHARDS